MKYSEEYTVRWHDTDAGREAKPSALLVLMQETANRQLHTFGLSPDDELRDRRGQAFLVSRMTLRILQPIHAFDRVTVQTWICEGRGLSYPRCFRILRGGETVADAYSVWGLMDLRAKRLVPAKEFSYGFEADELPDASLTGRIRLPALSEMEEVGERVIRYSDTDYNGHMNNTRYPDMLADYLPSPAENRVTELSFSFLREAALGHTLRVFRAAEEGAYSFRTLDGDGVCLEARLQTSPREEPAK